MGTSLTILNIVHKSVEPIQTLPAKVYECRDCGKEFFWTDGCLHRTIILDNYHDLDECLCKDCSAQVPPEQIKDV